MPWLVGNQRGNQRIQTKQAHGLEKRIKVWYDNLIYFVL